jgi:hypothetical protein
MRSVRNDCGPGLIPARAVFSVLFRLRPTRSRPFGTPAALTCVSIHAAATDTALAQKEALCQPSC